ncbi:MT-A70 family methyltransferase [Microbacterium capsulatum]|uniref:MT-A70 family methyltransferase n=1 Tax=Microbacterium capsulatum TaxID=3041921 RepID=A0ABU0XF55_9MICO|nr:MT-A70 family methyltransferase [Microbacterium sp. ASV81]MDQ4213749.1 MT-A70 family methyltransferase [Microbacterium sp. ASV81]
MTINEASASPTAGKEPSGIYDVILSDVPWRGQSGEKHYDTMSIDELLGMADAVKSVAADNSWLFFWTTKGLHTEAEAIIKAWGFDYAQGDWITWGKLNKFGFGRHKTGLRRATEDLLVATRGSVTAANRNVPDFLVYRVGRHSEKPHAQYAYIDDIAGMNVRRLELFARHKQPGWDAWGNEVDSDISLLEFGYPVPSDFTRAMRDNGDGDD